MTQAIPTVDEILARCEHRGWLGSGFRGARHMQEKLLAWRADGGEITVPASELRTALEAAYDPTMPDWPAMVEIEG
ncbi:MAG: hypothetical protein KGO47_07260 [Cyanobacteria bacterium REEB417]|nr:hypothetical protein [Cyanobacteria bacterium REEB417]